MRLWLAQLLGRARNGETSPTAAIHSAGNPIKIESLEHRVRSRLRLLLRHTWLVAILGTIVIGAALSAGIYFTTKVTVMKIAAGPDGGTDAKLVQILSDKIERDHSRVQLDRVTTTGPAESLQAINDDKVGLAVLPSIVGSSPDWSVVAILRQNVVALIVPAYAAKPSAAGEAPAQPAKTVKSSKGAKSTKSGKDAKNGKSDKSAKAEKSDKSDNADKSDEADSGEKVSQLAGQRIGILTGNDASADLLNLILKHYGVPLDKVQVSQIDPENLATAVRDKLIDAILVAAPSTGRAIGNAVAAATQSGQPPSFIAIDQAEGIAERDPAFDSVDIEAGTFGGNPPMPAASLKSLSFPDYLVARKDLGHDSVATLARAIYTSRQSLAAGTNGEVKIKAPSTEKDAAVIVHPGALSYLTDDQKTFFDKYGDAIFYGLLIFPFFGSAIAAVASYVRNNGRTRRLRLLQKLLDLVRKAHAAATLEALDQLQIEADNLVVAIIHQGEHEEFDETVRMSFSFALDQLRFAIAARRSLLLERGDADTKAGTNKAAAA